MVDILVVVRWMRQGFDLIRERKKQVGVELVSDSPVSSNSLISTELGGQRFTLAGYKYWYPMTGKV